MTLQHWCHPSSSARPLLCTGTALFSDLLPGVYILTLCRDADGIRLLLRLSPGAALTLCHDPATLRCGWRRDPFPFF